MKSNTAIKKLISSPYLIWAAIFIIVPLLFVVYYSVVDAGGNFTLEYVADIGKYKDIMLTSIWLGLIAT
ncbi:MAG: ABC transporter permease, partial [Faecalibacterium sp.]|nr:ABC transporter permease [Faecalibacterium sp.]